MDVSTVIARALSGLDKKTRYSSPGKMPSFAATTWPEGRKNDCSGFVSWVFRFSESRKVNHPLYKKVNGGWFETKAIYQDGLETTGFFKQLDTAMPGALLVYPDYEGLDGKTHDGHIGIVLEANDKGVSGVTKIIHCSAGNDRTTGDAIQITDAKPWLAHKESIIVWLEGTES